MQWQRNLNRGEFPIGLSRCPAGHSLEGFEHNAVEFRVDGFRDFHIADIAVFKHVEHHLHVTFNFIVNAVLWVANVGIEPAHEGRWATRKLRHFFHHVDGHDLRPLDGEVFAVAVVERVAVFKHDFAVVNNVGFRPVDAKDDVLLGEVNDVRTLFGRPFDDSVGRRAASGRDMLDGISLFAFKFFELSHFGGGVLKALVEFVAEVECESGGDDGRQKSSGKNKRQGIGVAPAYVLTNFVGAVILIAAIENDVAPRF